MKKRLVSILIMIAMLLTLTASAFAETGTAGETPAAAEAAPAEAVQDNPEAETPAEKQTPAEKDSGDAKAPAEDETEEAGDTPAETLAGGEDTPAEPALTVGGEDALSDPGQQTLGGGEGDGPAQAGELATVRETVKAETTLTAIMTGISDGNRQMILDGLAQYIDEAMREDYTVKVKEPALPDAEKYMLEGYDELLCWAAAAANMIWTSNIAQQAVNPDTGANFQNEDEVFNYFRNIFTDEVGRPDGAISAFVKGTYAFQDSAGIAHLKNPEGVSRLLPDGIETPDYGLYDLRAENVGDIAQLEKLDVQSLGVLLHSYDRREQRMGSLAHWVTSPGIVIDGMKTGLDRYKAILIADSDNDPVNGGADVPAAERARQAADAINAYTVYPLTLKSYSDLGQRWTIPYYSGSDRANFDVLIDWAAFVGVLSKEKAPVEAILPDDEDDWDDDGWDDDDWDYAWEYDEEQPGENTSAGGDDAWYSAAPETYDWEDFDWDEFAWEDFDWEGMDMDELNEFLDCVPADLIRELLDETEDQAGDSGFLTAVKTRMAEKDIAVLSPAGWRYSLTKGGRFLVIVRTDRTELLNVLLDGKALTEYRGDIEVLDAEGSFLLLLSEAVMQSLDEGAHTLELDLNGIGTITRSISVEK